MNISELARKLKITTQELKEKLPQLGFNIGMRAIQIPDNQVRKVIILWEKMKREEERRKKLEKIKLEKEEEEEKRTLEEKIVILPKTIIVHDLAEKLSLPVTKIIQELIKNGILATINENLDYEIAAIIAEQLGWRVQREEEKKKEEEKIISLKEKLESIFQKEDKKNLRPRPPVVMVVGHVDHGKTSLLDAIRQTQVVEQEVGAITQSISAYQVEKNNKTITFIDTPGHEDFKMMRIRGGKIADLAILVIAADDGVQPQTIESLKIIQEEKLPFIVAISKIDKPEASIEKVKKGLTELNVIPEDWGGKTICQPVSAKTKQGINELLELIFLIAEMEKEKLLTNPEWPVIGVVVESSLNKGEGPVATVLIYSGTLKKRDFVVIGHNYSRLRALKDWQGKELKEGKPSMPVKIIGLKAVPQVGDILEVKRGEIKKIKKEIKLTRTAFQKRAALGLERKIIKTAKDEETKLFNIILRTDLLGSLEAINNFLEKISDQKIKINVLRKGFGGITKTDVFLAKKNQSLIIGFNVKIPSEVLKLAQEEKVEIKTYQVIYDLIEEIKKRLVELKGVEIREEKIGQIKILAVFREEKNFSIVGGKIIEGKVISPAKIRIWRQEEIIGEGKLIQLQINKIDLKEGYVGQECGLKIATDEKIMVNDLLEVYLKKRG